jgi:predicted N-acetyltransferase YhbS
MSETEGLIKITDAPAEVGREIEAQLLQSLRNALPQGENSSFVLSARNQEGVLVGGLVASTSYGWLLTKCLWVAEKHRNIGLGRSLMLRAEEKGLEIGCHGAWLDTSSPSAMSFYSKLGYTSFGQLENRQLQQPPNHRRWFMSKELSKASNGAA